MTSRSLFSRIYSLIALPRTLARSSEISYTNHEPPNRPLEGTHFEKRELCGVLTGYLTSLERCRVLVHFGRGCPECWYNLSQLTRTDSISDFATSREWESTLEAGAPVRQALGRCYSFLSADRELGKDLAEEQDVFTRLRPLHRHALITTCREREADKKAVAFRWLALEESRHLVLHEASQLAQRTEATLKELQDAALEERCPLRMQALQALGWTYLADDRRLTGHYELVDDHLTWARRLFDKDPGQPEIQATYFEIVSDLARSQGNFFRALDATDAALKLLRNCPIPGRRAETLARRGLLWFRFGAPEKAIHEFRAVLDDIPPGYLPRLKLDAWHYMAMAEGRMNRFTAAKSALQEAEHLYDHAASILMLAQRAWLWGVIHLHDEQHARAESWLQEALRLFGDLRLVMDAAQTLMELGRLYAKIGAARKLAETTRHFVVLMNGSEALRLPQAQRQEIFEQLWNDGLTTPGMIDLSKLDWELEDPANATSDSDEWIN